MPRHLAAGTLLLLVAALAACDGHDLREREFVALGTVVTVSARDVPDERFAAAATAVERHLNAAGRAWYARAPGELKQLNSALAAGRGAVVTPALRDLLARSAELEQRTRGRFNACLGRLSEAWGFYDLPASPATLPPAAHIAAILASRPSCGDLEIDAGSGAVSSPNRLVAVDVGGIAKGALLADAAKILRDHGIENAIVDLGGDLIVIGRVAGRAARIGIRAPGGGAPLAGLKAQPGEAVMTSGNYERYVTIDGERYAHILDPVTGRPVAHTASVTVVHGDPVLADAAATALLVGGPDAFDELVAALGLEYALLVAVNGDTRLTSGMAERLHWSRND